MPKKEFYTDVEVAKILHLNVETVRFLCERGNFEHAQKNEQGKWVFSSNQFNISKKQTKQIQKEVDTFDKHTRQILKNTFKENDSDE